MTLSPLPFEKADNSHNVVLLGIFLLFVVLCAQLNCWIESRRDQHRLLQRNKWARETIQLEVQYCTVLRRTHHYSTLGNPRYNSYSRIAVGRTWLLYVLTGATCVTSQIRQYRKSTTIYSTSPPAKTSIFHLWMILQYYLISKGSPQNLHMRGPAIQLARHNVQDGYCTLLYSMQPTKGKRWPILYYCTSTLVLD